MCLSTDALYAHYFLLARLISAGVDLVIEQHGSRSTDFRRGRRLGARDHEIDWVKPRHRPGWMSPEDYATAPKTVRLREVRVGGRVLVTTLRDERQVHKYELDALYHRRWNIELNLASLKTTLGMDVLRGRSPAMVEKELWVYLLAYNLIRLPMAQAAVHGGCCPREISFKHTVQMWTAWQMRPDHPGDPQILLSSIATIRVGHRPGRHEPRAKKRRPKSFPWMKVARVIARRRNRAHPDWLRAK